MRKKRAYLIGIKGVAMTALAVYLKEAGYQVLGSDVDDFFPTDTILHKYQIEVKRGFSPANIQGNFDLVVVTGAHGGMTNPEAKQAKKLHLPTFMHGEMVGKLMEDKYGISVSGCHGKTTTSSLISTLFYRAKFDPSYLVGTSEINGLGPAGHFGGSKYFIAEADEYMTCPVTDPRPRFLWQNPKILVITNIEYDHPDAFPSLSAIKKAFYALSQKVTDKGLIIACIDNSNIRDVLSNVKKEIITYGFSPKSDFQVTSYSFDEGVSFMRINHHQLSLGEFMLRIPGKHNLLNALACGIVANQVGLSWERIRDLLKLYTGCKRRFEKIGQIGSILLYDDYAHHPSEIKATIAAAREWFKTRRIIVIFQPHTYSRTKALMNEFTHAFVDADLAIICDIYPSARESFDPSISSKQLVLEINKNRKNSIYRANNTQVMSYLDSYIKTNDLIITMGAGNIFLWHKGLIDLLKNKRI
jgi:UDP-N-acetylmuramate--alanine ligase